MHNRTSAFLTEMGFTGRIGSNHQNMRTEFAWMHALNAMHYNIHDFHNVNGYDDVYIIFPKGRLSISAETIKIKDVVNPASELLRLPIVSTLKQHNNKVHYIQEGTTWWFNEYEVEDQLLFFNMLFECDSIFSHNEYDVNFYRGLYPDKKIRPIQTLMFEYNIKDMVPTKQEKCIIGGNFSRWYGGFQGYVIGQELGVPLWTQESHARRENEDRVEGLNHLPRLYWDEWMKVLSTFKYAIHLMPTIAAGTFSLNCAYFGIPCIGNYRVDTQRLLHPNLSVDVDDVAHARELVIKLKEDKQFYELCSKQSKELYTQLYHHSNWLDKFTQRL